MGSRSIGNPVIKMINQGGNSLINASSPCKAHRPIAPHIDPDSNNGDNTDEKPGEGHGSVF
jgi:hypothetical protein